MKVFMAILNLVLFSTAAFAVPPVQMEPTGQYKDYQGSIGWLSLRIDSKPLKNALSVATADVANHKSAWGEFGKTAGETHALRTEDPRTGYASCFNYKEISFSLICVFNSQLVMTDVFGRGIDSDSGKFQTDKAHLLDFHFQTQGVHSTAAAILNIWKIIQDPQTHDLNGQETGRLLPEYAKLRLEKENSFFKYFAQPLAEKGYEIIAVTKDNAPERMTQFLSHELMHSQWKSVENYSKTIAYFWNSIDIEDRKQILTDLEAQGYQFTQSAEVVNEFQAYMLQYNSDKSILAKWTPKYRQDLRQSLTHAGLKVFYFGE